MRWLGGARKETDGDPVSEALWRRGLRSAADGPVHGAKAAAVALLVASLVFGTAGVARAEWPPPHRPPTHKPCTEQFWRSHRQGRCGWRTTQAVVRHIFTHGYATADCIVDRESGYYAKARNGQYRGLWQFGASWYVGHFNPENPVVATLRAWAATSRGTTWGPWGGGC